ncbi:response regulator [Elusimicrobiota bacterium]
MKNERLKILLIDDEIDIRMILKAYLSPYHVEVIETDDGTEAIGILNEQDIDLIILDYYMPKMCGEEILVKMLDDKKLENIPVIMYTSGDFEDIKLRQLRHFTHAFLSKSSIGDDLIPTVREILGDRLQVDMNAVSSIDNSDHLDNTSFKSKKRINVYSKPVDDNNISPKKRSASPKVFICMKEVSSLLMTQSYLKKHNIDAIGASSDAEAAANIGDDDSPDLAIIDDFLFDNTLLRLLKISTGKDPVPVIMVAEKNHESYLDEEFRKYVSEYLVRPITEEKLMNMVTRVISFSK